MRKFKNTVFGFIKTRKITSIILVLIILGIGYTAYAKLISTNGETSYVVTNVKKGDIIQTITGTGQVSASSQVDIKSKASGDLVYLNTAANGTEVKKGSLIAKVDVRDVEITLANAKIAYAKLIKPADLSTTLQTENALNDAVSANNKSYDDALSTLATTFSDLPNIINGIDNLLYGQDSYLSPEKVRTVSQTGLDYQNKAGASLDKVKTRYRSILIDYKNLSRASASSTIESFVGNAYQLLKDVSETAKNTQNALDYIRNIRNDGSGTTESANLSSWISTINSDLANLLSAKTNILSAAQTVSQKKADLIKLETGPDDLDIASQKLNLQQAENTYSDYFIRAPFDGLLAKLSVKATDTVNSGTIIGTLVSSQKLTVITLNEVDVSKVKIGQKAKLTFDAIDGLTIDGTVTTVDLIGTVSQGVVNYNVEITLDNQDDRIKSGMSVSAAIIVDQKNDVLTIPNSAIKSQGKFSFVEIFTTPITVVRGSTGTPSTIKPIQKRVVTGLSDDASTEIISGLNEGDQVVTRTINATTAVAKTTTPTIFGTGTRTGGAASTGVRLPRN